MVARLITHCSEHGSNIHHRSPFDKVSIITSIHIYLHHARAAPFKVSEAQHSFPHALGAKKSWPKSHCQVPTLL